jgi:hypothetical protein
MRTHFSAVPPDIGRVARKFTSVKGIKADEWRNWTTLFSEIALFSCGELQISIQAQRIWSLYAEFVRIILLRFITPAQIEHSRLILLQFLREFKFLYGRWAVTPNMHFAIHCAEIVSTMGPALSFSAFPYVLISGGKLYQIRFFERFLHNLLVNRCHVFFYLFPCCGVV